MWKWPRARNSRLIFRLIAASSSSIRAGSLHRACHDHIHHVGHASRDGFVNEFPSGNVLSENYLSEIALVQNALSEKTLVWKNSLIEKIFVSIFFVWKDLFEKTFVWKDSCLERPLSEKTFAWKDPFSFYSVWQPPPSNFGSSPVENLPPGRK